MSINSVAISGHLTANSFFKVTSGGTPVLEFTVVVDERKKSANGEWTNVPNYFQCVIFGSRAESLSRIFSKGMKVAVSGRLRYESWEKEGQKRSSVCIVAEDVEIMSRRESTGSSQNQQMDNYTSQEQTAPQMTSSELSQPFSDYYESDIPF